MCVSPVSLKANVFCSYQTRIASNWIFFSLNKVQLKALKEI